jgi:hypothetical protein
MAVRQKRRRLVVLMAEAVQKIRIAVILNHITTMPQIVVLAGRRGLNQIGLIVLLKMALQKIPAIIIIIVLSI